MLQKPVTKLKQKPSQNSHLGEEWPLLAFNLQYLEPTSNLHPKSYRDLSMILIYIYIYSMSFKRFEDLSNSIQFLPGRRA